MTAPNTWTQYLSGDLTDSDKDGMTDVAERKYGFDPYDKNSFPAEAILINTNTVYPDVSIDGSGNRAVYMVVEYNYIRIKWQNPANGHYNLFLYNKNYEIYCGDHQTQTAELSFASKCLNGTEILNGYFVERDSSGQIVQTLPTFYFDLNTITFGAPPAPVIVHPVGSADNRITYSFKNFGSAQETAYRNLLRRVFPILYEKLGPPAESFNCIIENTGSMIAFYSTNNGRLMKTNGNLLPTTIVHEFVHAWKGGFPLSAGPQWECTYNLAGFEEGSAQGMSFEIMHEYVKSYPADPVSLAVMGDKIRQYWDIATTCYDLVKKRRYMGGGDMWNGGLQTDRYCVAGTTFQIMENENPSFYKDFMKKYFEKINADPSFRPTEEGLARLISEVNPHLYGMNTEQYISSLPVFQGHSLDAGMYVINTSSCYGQSSIRSVTASYAHKYGNLFWAIPTSQLSAYDIPSWITLFRTANDSNYIDIQNQPFSVLVFDNRNQLIKTVNGYTAVARNTDGTPADLGKKQIDDLNQQYLPSGLYKMTVAFDNFTAYDPHATETEYLLGLNGINQDKTNEYIIMIGIAGVENGAVKIELNGVSYSASLSNGLAIFRSNAWPFDLKGQFKIIVTDSSTGTSHDYYRTIVEAATPDGYFQQQCLIIDSDFDGIEEL
jgi:hypothetical protein